MSPYILFIPTEHVFKCGIPKMLTFFSENINANSLHTIYIFTFTHDPKCARNTILGAICDALFEYACISVRATSQKQTICVHFAQVSETGNRMNIYKILEHWVGPEHGIYANNRNRGQLYRWKIYESVQQQQQNSISKTNLN